MVSMDQRILNYTGYIPVLPTARICPYFYGKTMFCPQYGFQSNHPGKAKKDGVFERREKWCRRCPSTCHRSIYPKSDRRVHELYTCHAHHALYHALYMAFPPPKSVEFLKKSAKHNRFLTGCHQNTTQAHDTEVRK